MFNPFRSEGPKAGNDTNFFVSDDLRIAIEDAGLGNDPAVKAMIETGFVSPNGTEYDPFEFIAKRKELVESGDVVATTPDTAGSMVEHSKAPEEEHGSLSQL
jgi:hypothetical protein